MVRHSHLRRQARKLSDHLALAELSHAGALKAERAAAQEHRTERLEVAVGMVCCPNPCHNWPMVARMAKIAGQTKAKLDDAERKADALEGQIREQREVEWIIKAEVREVGKKVDALNRDIVRGGYDIQEIENKVRKNWTKK